MLRKIAQQIDPEFRDPKNIATGVILNEKSLQRIKDQKLNTEPQYISSDPSILRWSNQRGLDPGLYEVTKVFYSTPNYAIFEVNDSDCLEYITTDDVKFNTQAISLQINRIEFWLIDSDVHLHPEGHFLETLADAIALSLEGKNAEASRLIVELETLIKSEVYKDSKLVYIFPYIVLVACMVIIAVWLQFNDCVSHSLVCWGSPKNGFTFFFNVCTFGAIGCLLSVGRNLDNYSIEIKYRKTFWLSLWDRFLLAVLLRFMISVLGAIVMYVFLHADILNPQIGIKENHYFVYSLALVAGFSENLISNLMTKFEANISKGEAMRVKPETSTPVESSVSQNSGKNAPV